MTNEHQLLDPVAWCQRMIDTAINGEVAYIYHQLKEQWQAALTDEAQTKGND